MKFTKNKFLSLFTILPVMVLSSCGSRLRGGVGFMHKQSGNSYGEALYNGLSQYYNEEEHKCVTADKSPSEQSVANQVQMIETLTMMGVKGIIVSSSGVTGYDNILERTTAKGIKVVSVDSPISPKYRSIHIDHCDPEAVGAFLARAATIIGIGQRLKAAGKTINEEDYDYVPSTSESEGDDKDNLKNKTKKAIEAFIEANLNDKLKFGIISSTSDSPSQNEWISYIFKEFENGEKNNNDYPNYKEVVEYDLTTKKEPSVQYGLEDPTKSGEIAQTLCDKVDVIIAPSTVAMLASGEKVSSIKTKTKVTGLGMPKEMCSFMPKNKDDKPSEAVCPFMMLWNVIDFGYIAGQALEQALNGTSWTDKDKFTYHHLNSNAEIEVDIKPTYNDDGTLDGGYKAVVLDPLAFCRANIEEWKEKL